MTWTIDDLMRRHAEAGGTFFTPASLRFFGTNVFPKIYQGPGGVYFITRDKMLFEPGKAYYVHGFDPETGNISQHPDWHCKKVRAVVSAMAMAAG